MSRLLHLAGFVSMAVLTSSCTQFGDHMIRPANYQYNQAIARSWVDQLLLNIVRLHYGDTPMFMDVTSLVTSYSFGGNLSANANLGKRGSADDTLSGSAGINYSERPTISYAPLRGEACTSRLLRPISPDTIILLVDGGWQAKVALLTCVQEINGVKNIPAAPGNGRFHAARYDDFRNLIDHLDELDSEGHLNFQLTEDALLSRHLIIEPGAIRSQGECVSTVRGLLKLPADRSAYRLAYPGISREPDQIMIKGRSLLGVLQFLSHGVESPEAHVRKGEVYQVLDENGEICDPIVWMKDIFQIRSSKLPPKKVYGSVKYRGYHFYIPHHDLSSKTTFGLLNQLFSLQAASSGGASPLLTIPTS